MANLLVVSKTKKFYLEYILVCVVSLISLVQDNVVILNYFEKNDKKKKNNNNIRKNDFEQNIRLAYLKIVLITRL